MSGKRRNPLHDAANLIVSGLPELHAELDRKEELLMVAEKTIERQNGQIADLKDRNDYLERQVAHYMRFTTEVVTHFKHIRLMMSGSFADISGLMDECIEKSRAEAFAPSGLPHGQIAADPHDPPPKFLTDALLGLRVKAREEGLLAGVAAGLAAPAPNGAGAEVAPEDAPPF